MTRLDDTVAAMTRGTSITTAIDSIRAALEPYVFRATSEATLQAQVAGVLAPMPSIHVDTEVRRKGGRFDLLVRYALAAEFYPTLVVLVLELKLHSSPAPVERQAQRYAMMDDVDAVGVVTTSRRLAAGLGGMAELGGKPFFVVAVRTT